MDASEPTETDEYAFTIEGLKDKLATRLADLIPAEFFPDGVPRAEYVGEMLYMSGERPVERARDFLRHLSEARMRGALKSWPLACATAFCILNGPFSDDDIPEFMRDAFEPLDPDPSISIDVTECTHIILNDPTQRAPLSWVS